MTVYVEVLLQSEQQALRDLAREPLPDGDAGLAAGTFIPVDEDLLAALGGTRAGYAEYWIRAAWRRVAVSAPWALVGRRTVYGAAAPTADEPWPERTPLGEIDIQED